MADHQKMYTTLFNAVTDAVNILKEAQQATEESYISAKEPVLTILRKSEINNDDEGDVQS